MDRFSQAFCTAIRVSNSKNWSGLVNWTLDWPFLHYATLMRFTCIHRLRNVFEWVLVLLSTRHWYATCIKLHRCDIMQCADKLFQTVSSWEMAEVYKATWNWFTYIILILMNLRHAVCGLYMHNLERPSDIQKNVWVGQFNIRGPSTFHKHQSDAITLSNQLQVSHSTITTEEMNICPVI